LPKKEKSKEIPIRLFKNRTIGLTMNKNTNIHLNKHTNEIAVQNTSNKVVNGWLKIAIAPISALAVSACGGGGGSTSESKLPVTNPVSKPNGAVAKLAPSEDRQAARFLQQAQFSSTMEEIADLRRGSYEDWMQKQFGLPRDQSGWDWLWQRKYQENDVGTKNTYYVESVYADFMIWNQLFTGQEQMRKRIALALSEFFVVSMESGNMIWPSQLFATWWDILCTNAFENFRTLLEDVTKNNAMGYYLNTKGNQKADDTGRQPDENYAREVMQLFTIGLYNLKDDGTYLNDPPVESYSQSDVTNLARVFTGYDIDKRTMTNANGPRGNYPIPVVQYTLNPMVFKSELHSMDTNNFNFFGATISGQDSGPVKLQKALDTLFNHKNTAPFFCKQMIQRLVTSNPSPSYVARVTAKFIDNGNGARGDLKAVWIAILTDPEARWTEVAPAGHGKLREPMVRFIQWGRTFDFKSKSNGWKMPSTKDPSTDLGQSPLRSPSVFNFFRPGFIPPGLTSIAPEFQIVNETSVAGYLNFMQRVLQAGIYVSVPAKGLNAYGKPYEFDLGANYSDELIQVAKDSQRLIDRMNLTLCGSRMSADTASTIKAAITNMPATSDQEKTDRIRSAILMTMACAEYLIQK
jgi:uncharacterized protein (DUF1800 family)